MNISETKLLILNKDSYHHSKRSNESSPATLFLTFFLDDLSGDNVFLFFTLLVSILEPLDDSSFLFRSEPLELDKALNLNLLDLFSLEES
ncbi:hypothetical protein PICMEDRAFT_158488 [Pichia membranifaciens NRRL Y-2026]|uniref:Uncharacterized protein n=1 Tax=Pichia membranifaciens NRRL Y-2026 TaxID=763406 RepID=A0A1E3NHJ0_9ASCO|nr:hypothetical protein PICMEDRAFT_158488 [Pichia membranifaciens NRRL Y-2026]ODQ45028.1 hypothetical protein PICMEDRAFT_158488 [Pichia membranifaciens NRRL Y-2026]